MQNSHLDLKKVNVFGSHEQYLNCSVYSVSLSIVTLFLLNTSCINVLIVRVVRGKPLIMPGTQGSSCSRMGWHSGYPPPSAYGLCSLEELGPFAKQLT